MKADDVDEAISLMTFVAGPDSRTHISAGHHGPLRVGIGGPVGSPDGGASCGVESNWVRRSGDAPSKNQIWPSGEKASWVCVRDVAFRVPERRLEQLRQPQFHCGKPPPAAEPRILICIAKIVSHDKNGERTPTAKQKAGRLSRPRKLTKLQKRRAEG